MKVCVKTVKLWMLLATAAVTAASCGEDEYYYPSVKLEYLTGYTDAEGMLSSVRTDDGQVYPVSAGAEDLRTSPDSLLRFISNYAVEQTSGGSPAVRLYGVGRVVAPEPRPASAFKDGVHTDAVQVGSIWMGWNYLNILLEVKAGQGTHTFGFVEDAYVAGAAGGESSVRLTLYHNSGDDVPAYTQRAYLSVPLSRYAAGGVEQVSLSFRINTSDKGWQTWQFEYKPR